MPEPSLTPAVSTAWSGHSPGVEQGQVHPPVFRTAVAAADPDAEWIEPPAPWNGVFEARTGRVRFYLVHQVEELARHAGHADIIREQIDGIAIPAIVLSEAGMAASSFFTPYVAVPGTIGTTGSTAR